MARVTCSRFSHGTVPSSLRTTLEDRSGIVRTSLFGVGHIESGLTCPGLVHAIPNFSSDWTTLASDLRVGFLGLFNRYVEGHQPGTDVHSFSFYFLVHTVSSTSRDCPLTAQVHYIGESLL